MPKSISFHNGTNWSRGHNIRDERYTNKQEHIDPTLSHLNLTICDIPVRQAYANIFGKAVEEYNAKQKRTDRKITDYYEKIKADKRKHPVYEVIVQIGDRDDTGQNAEVEKQALKIFVEQWESRNPHLRLIGAYIHADEPDGTVHMHIDYIPVAECSRGMRIQNSLDRALQQQGFQTENIHQTAQIAWQNREREALNQICQSLNINSQPNQNIGKGRPSLTVQEYKRAKQQQQQAIEQELQPYKDELKKYKDLRVKATSFTVDKKKIPLTKRVSLPSAELEKLEHQAMAYRTNRDEIDNLRKLRKKYEQDVRMLKARDSDISQRESTVTQLERQVKAEYERQRNLNEILIQTEQQLAVLRKENEQLQKDGEMAQDIFKILRATSESLKDIVQAISSLKYKQDLFGNLTKEQEVLIDAITNYAISREKRNGFDDLAKAIQKQYGISSDVQKEIDKLIPPAPKKRRGMSL